MNAARRLLFLCVTASCARAETAPPPQSPTPAAAPAHLPTALDVMLAHAGDLELRPEQVAHMKAVSKDLEATNAPLEQSLARAEPTRAPAEASEAPPAGRHGGGGGRGAFRGGGRGGMGGGRGGMGGGRYGRQGQPQGTTPGGNTPGTGQAQARPHSDQAETLRAQMADNHAAAVARAFSVLDDAQQERAARLLDENDFEPPTVDSVRAARQADAHHAAGR
jgi:hypothetical protein